MTPRGRKTIQNTAKYLSKINGLQLYFELGTVEYEDRVIS